MRRRLPDPGKGHRFPCSQFRSTMKIDGDASEAATQRQKFVQRITSRLAEHGALAGFAHGEAFKLISQL